MKNLFNKLPVVLILLLSVTHLVAQGAPKAEAPASTLIGNYLAVQEALAADNLEAAKKGASALRAGLLGTTDKASEAMAETAKAIESATKLSDARAAFYKLSETIILLVSKGDLSVHGDIYNAYCPMAFDNKGAGWLQSGKTVNNPYYGASMLRCGSIKKTIKPDKKQADAVDHSAHH